MKSAILIGKSGKTDIQYKKLKIQKLNKTTGEITTIEKDTDIMIEGHQGGNCLTGRVLRPSEVLALQNVIKFDNNELTMFNSILLLGARYEECRTIQRDARCFEGSFVKVSNKKVKAIETQGSSRNIKLSNMGKIVVAQFFYTDKRLPTVSAYNEKLRRWAHLASIDEAHISVRMLRKSWESWLVVCYPEYINMIVKSQGHTEKTAMKHYIDIRFENEDIQQMRPFVEGWKPESRDW